MENTERQSMKPFRVATQEDLEEYLGILRTQGYKLIRREDGSVNAYKQGKLSKIIKARQK